MLSNNLLCWCVANVAKQAQLVPLLVWGPTNQDVMSSLQASFTARPSCCKHIKWEWDLVELVLPGHQPKDVTTHRWSQLPFYLLLLHLVSSEQELLPCDSDAFIEWTAIQMAISGIETVTLRCKPCCQWWFQGWGVEMTLIIFGRLYRGGKWIWSFP